MDNTQKVVWYKSEDGIYVSKPTFNYTGNRDRINVALINDKVPTDTHLYGWQFVEGETELKSLKDKKTGPICNIRYELINPSLAGDKIPLVLTDKQVNEEEDWEDDDEPYSWHNPEFNSLRSLYERKYDREPAFFVEVPFEAEYLGEILADNVNNISNATYKINRGHYASDGFQDINIKDVVKYYELEQMLVSDLLLHNRPCYLDSPTTYKIVRNYIKDNINPKTAIVSSDYDFCFTVEKKISVKPWVNRREILTSRGKSYRPLKFTSSNVEYKKIKVFEMTNSKDKYQGYSVIDGFKGDNLKNLIDNIKLFLDELLEFINQEVSECEHCKGTGHLVMDTFDKNKRTQDD